MTCGPPRHHFAHHTARDASLSKAIPPAMILTISKAEISWLWMVYLSSRYETSKSHFNTLALWGLVVVQPRLHLIPGLLLSTFKQSFMPAWHGSHTPKVEGKKWLWIIRLSSKFGLQKPH